jgi:hypothetical protein
MFGLERDQQSKPSPERRIQVYDAVNKDRLLGSIPVPSMAAAGRHIVFPTMAPPMSLYDAAREFSPSMRFDTVEMEVSHRYDATTWTAEFILVTSTPLNVLTRVRDFRLPGENEGQAADRRYWYR